VVCTDKKTKTEKKPEVKVEQKAPTAKIVVEQKKEPAPKPTPSKHPAVDRIQTLQRTVKLGDTYEEITAKFDKPQVEYALSESKTSVSYPHSKFIFRNQKLISAQFLSRTEMIKKGL